MSRDAASRRFCEAELDESCAGSGEADGTGGVVSRWGDEQSGPRIYSSRGRQGPAAVVAHDPAPLRDNLRVDAALLVLEGAERARRRAQLSVHALLLGALPRRLRQLRRLRLLLELLELRDELRRDVRHALPVVGRLLAGARLPLPPLLVPHLQLAVLVAQLLQPACRLADAAPRLLGLRELELQPHALLQQQPLLETRLLGQREARLQPERLHVRLLVLEHRLQLRHLLLQHRKQVAARAACVRRQQRVLRLAERERADVLALLLDGALHVGQRRLEREQLSVVVVGHLGVVLFSKRLHRLAQTCACGCLHASCRLN